MKKSIIVITTNINNQKHYVGNNDVSAEGGRSRIVTYTQVAEEAKEFATKGLAQDFIAKIKNPFERSFQWGRAEVDVEKRKTLLSKNTAEEALALR